MTTQVENYNKLISIGQANYDYVAEGHPELITQITDHFEFHVAMTAAAKGAGSVLLSKADSTKPDEWQIGVVIHLVNHALEVITEVLADEGMLADKEDTIALIKVFHCQPKELQKQLLLGLSHACFMGEMQANDLVNPTTTAICSVATEHFAQILKATHVLYEVTGDFLKKGLTKSQRKAMKAEKKKVMGSLEQASKDFRKAKGFKN